MSFLAAVADVGRLHRQLDRLAARARGRRLEVLAQDGVRFAELLDERERVVTLLARALGDGSFRPGVARVVRAELAGKARAIARVGALDHVAHAAVAEVLAETIEPTLSPCLWSYRRGRSSWQALRAIARYVRSHRRGHADPRTRGLYVLRADVRAYTDEIPVGDDAPLWADIASAASLDGTARAMVVALMRPELDEGDGRPTRPDRGLLFGLPTTTVSANLYLRPLDRALETLEGAYARFGDDVLFASERPEITEEASTLLAKILGERGLRVNAKKLRRLYWNGAARPSTAWPDAEPASQITFLGGALQWSGAIALPREKWSALLRALRTSVRRTLRLGREGEAEHDSEEEAKLLAAIVNDALDVRSPVALPWAPLLDDLVSDRAQLAQLDHLIALAIAEAITGTSGAKAFRAMPPRKLRTAGLRSRVEARNRGR